jgi:integrase
MKKHEWGTPLGLKMSEYLEIKRLSGFKYELEERRLERFDDFCATKKYDKEYITRDIAEGFIYGVSYEKPSTHYTKEKLLRSFGNYLCDCGYDSYVCPTKSIPKKRGCTPYIYTESELYALFQVIDNFSPHPMSNRHLIDPLLFRMAYGCGLRISEALNLRVADVDIEHGILSVLYAKNNKDRFVPMSESLRLRCEDFRKTVHTASASDEIFFRSPRGGVLDLSTAYRRFREYLWEAGISHSGRGPRIHDLRHTYCVHRLKKWVLSGKDLLNLLPYLSVYLGHADFRGTQYYLRLTADIYPDIISKEEAVLGCVFQERGVSDAY